MITRTIFDWAGRTPGRTAAVFDGRPLSYRAFSDRIAAARGYFARRGYAGGGVAVVAVVNLLDSWMLSLALRSLGFTTFAIDPTQPDALAGLIGVRLVACTAAASPELERFSAAAGCEILRVSLDGEIPLDLKTEDGVDGGQILRTSGTTGAYKFVLITSQIDQVSADFTRRALGADQQSLINVFSFGAWTGVGYRFPAMAWIIGAGVVFRQSGRFEDSMIEPGVTHAVLIPELLTRILATPLGAFPRREALRLAVGGGPMAHAQIEQAKARITPDLHNLLGATEAGIMAFTALKNPEDCRWQTIAPGRLVEIVDEKGRTLPAGKVGRVRVGVAGWPNAYLHDEAATRAAFADGYFYPGDLGVLREDGRLALHGRVTDVINVNGHKLSPAPIEARLRDALSVSDLCLVTAQDAGGEEQAYLVIESTTPIAEATLAQAVSRELPRLGQICVQFVAALPRNEMGKIMRQAVTARVLGEG